MAPIIFILAGTVVILLFLVFLKDSEIRSIKKQIERISGNDSNEIVHNVYGGTAQKELINSINSLLKEMRRSRIKYHSKRHDLEQMMTNISHDLRTPLTSAMGYVDIIINSDISPEEKEREIRIVKQRLIQLEELIDSFFEFSKIISRDKPPELEIIDLVGALQEAIVHYYDDYGACDRAIHFECRKMKINVLSNRNMIMRIFDNLIGNACKHSMGDLDVTVIETEGKVHILFENDFNDSRLETDRIFDEFYTTDISRTKGSTGLGLAIAKQFTEMLGGTISAVSDEMKFI